MFDRAAYGCKLFCCWCAQDIAANRFWEAMGFVPLAYRAGSEKRGKNGGARVHIFWQKRIRSGDTGERATPWWFPSKTGGGSIREDRLVFPIPPGTHWSDAKPLVLPADDGADVKALPAPSPRAKKAKPIEKQNAVARNGMWFDVPRQGEPVAAAKQQSSAPKRTRKHDPRLVSAARELRDRYLEHVNTPGVGGLVLGGNGKYDVSRAGLIDAPPARATPLLEAA